MDYIILRKNNWYFQKNNLLDMMVVIQIYPFIWLLSKLSIFIEVNRIWASNYGLTYFTLVEMYLM